MFDFTISYQTRRSNKATNTLSRHPHNEEDLKIGSGSDCEEVEVILYSSVCEVVDTYLNATKVAYDLKKKALLISYVIQPIIEEEDVEEIQSMLNSVSFLNQVIPEDMAEGQKKNFILRLVCPYVAAREKLKSSAIAKINQRLYENTFYTLTVLHCLCINNDVDYHQMILPIRYQVQMIQMLLNGQGHQGMKRTTTLGRECFYCSTMHKDVVGYVRNCP